MSRLGWAILAAILAAGALFVSLLSFGPAPTGSVRDRVRRALPFERGEAPSGRLVIPVAGYAAGALRDSWGDARAGGARAHHGIDLMAPGGTAVVAAAPGRIEKLFQSRAGGTTLYVRSDDGQWSYYYAHLAGYAPGMRQGLAVRAGDLLGYVGDSGNAGAGNTHLHFGISRMRGGEGWWQGEPVDPYPILAGARPPR